MENFFQNVLWGNTIAEYTFAAGCILVSWFLLRITNTSIIGYLKKLAAKTSTAFDDILVTIAEKFAIPYLYLLINYSIITQLRLSPKADKIIAAALMFVTCYYVVRLVNYSIYAFISKYMEQKEEPPERIRQLSGMLIVLKIITWGLGIIFLIDNLGYNITTIIAGLGVGGIAVALAAQNIIGDLFSYFVIFFDKPFEIGDFIIVNSNMGVVEKIGIKTSHIRSLDGQQLVMPNAEMVKSVIQNYKRLQRRRVVFKIGVTYNTPYDKLKIIPGMIKKIIDELEIATFDRTHLNAFGDFSINYEIVYYIESADYVTYMDTHQAICMAIFEQFEKNSIDFAFPTQTLFIKNQNTVAEHN